MCQGFLDRVRQIDSKGCQKFSAALAQHATARAKAAATARDSSNCPATTMSPRYHLRGDSLRRQNHAARTVQHPSRSLTVRISKPFRFGARFKHDDAGIIESPNAGLLTIDLLGNTDRRASTFRRERHSTSASHEAHHCARRGSGLGNLRSRPVSLDTPLWSPRACMS